MLNDFAYVKQGNFVERGAKPSSYVPAARTPAGQNRTWARLTAARRRPMEAAVPKSS